MTDNATRFTVASRDVAEGQPLPRAQLSGIFRAGGSDTSPHLHWAGAPPGTAGYAITVYDRDAPTGSGFWHWAIADIPAECTQLPTGAGDATGSGLPAGAYQLRNDAGFACFLGAAPPARHGRHRYVFTVHAVDTNRIGIGPDGTPAMLGFALWQRTLATATLTAWAEA
jgi:Raf kinase inhibitor-like YbhB/YbcL family protein